MASQDGFKATELLQAQTHLYRHIHSFLCPLSLKWAVDLGIPDIIHNYGRPITLPELVSALHVPQAKASCVQRLMRLLAHNGFFAAKKINDNDEEKQAYVLTPASELLVKGTDHCLSPLVEWVVDPALIGSFHQLGKWIYGEEPTLMETALGAQGHWDFVNQNPMKMKIFNKAMESDSHLVRLALRDCKPVFEGLDSIVDVGGGTGNTAKIISEAFPRIKFIVLDLPQVVADLSESHNLSYVGGNMFELIPQTDAVLLKCVLHNWNDDDCIKILKKCKEAISAKGKGGKVIIIDMVMNEKYNDHEMTETKLFLDIIMMTAFNGKERDEKEWKQLFEESGFSHYKILPIFGFRSLIEVFP